MSGLVPYYANDFIFCCQSPLTFNFNVYDILRLKLACRISVCLVRIIRKLSTNVFLSQKHTFLPFCSNAKIDEFRQKTLHITDTLKTNKKTQKVYMFTFCELTCDMIKIENSVISKKIIIPKRILPSIIKKTVVKPGFEPRPPKPVVPREAIVQTPAPSSHSNVCIRFWGYSMDLPTWNFNQYTSKHLS